MTPSNLRSLAADLREARRYIGANWDDDAAAATLHSGRLISLAIAFQMQPDIPRFELFNRLGHNLRAGAALVVMTPGVLRAYLECAAVEVDGVAEGMERSAGESPPNG